MLVALTAAREEEELGAAFLGVWALSGQVHSSKIPASMLGPHTYKAGCQPSTPVLLHGAQEQRGTHMPAMGPKLFPSSPEDSTKTILPTEGGHGPGDKSPLCS